MRISALIAHKLYPYKYSSAAEDLIMCFTPCYTSTKITKSKTFTAINSTSTMPAFRKFLSRSTALPRQQDSAGAMPRLASASFSIRKVFQKKAPKVKISSHVLDGLILKDKEGSIIPPPTLDGADGYQLRDMSTTKTSLDHVLLPDHGTCQCCFPAKAKPDHHDQSLVEDSVIGEDSTTTQTRPTSAKPAKPTKFSTKNIKKIKAKMVRFNKGVCRTYKAPTVINIGTD